MDIKTFKKIRNILGIILFIAMACGAMEFGIAVIFFGMGGLLLFWMLIQPLYKWLKDKAETKQMLKEIKRDIEKNKISR